MWGLARTDELGFPACVPARCHEFDDSNYAGSWAAPVHATLKTRSVPHSFQTDVLAVCPDLLDLGSDEEEQPAVELLAYAYYFHQQGQAVRLVTEESGPHPFRMSLAEAATVIGMTCLSMGEFIRERRL